MRQAQMAKADKEAEDAGLISLFDASDFAEKANDKLGEVLWTPQPTWDPVSRDWWSDST